MIFARRWHDVRGETLGAGTPHAINVIRVQLEKDGPWSSLTEDEVSLLLIQHNQIVDPNRKEVPDIIEKAKIKPSKTKEVVLQGKRYGKTTAAKKKAKAKK